MTKQELMDFFVGILESNWPQKEKLGGTPANVNNSLSLLSRNITIQLGKFDCPEVDLSEIRGKLSEHFGNIGNELMPKTYDEKLMKIPIAAIQVYNYIVTAVEIVADYTGCDIPEDLFWDYEWDDNSDIAQEATEPPEPAEKPKKSLKKAGKEDAKVEENGYIAADLIKLLTSIDQKLSIIADILTKTTTEK